MKYIPFPAIPSHSCIKLPPILQFDHFSPSPLDSDNSQRYPMHMRLNGVSKTLIRLTVDWRGISNIRPHTVQKHRATTAKRPLLNPRAAHNRRAATKRVRWVRRRGRLRRGAVAALNGGRSLMNEAGGRFTHGCLVLWEFWPLFFWSKTLCPETRSVLPPICRY